MYHTNIYIHTVEIQAASHPHPHAHRRLLQPYPSLPFYCGSEAGKLPWDPHGKRAKEQPKDYITQLINKLMRSHFLWKRVSRKKVPPQPFSSCSWRTNSWYYTVEKESSQQEIKLNYHPDRFMWRFTFSLCCFPLRVEVCLSLERDVKCVVKLEERKKENKIGETVQKFQTSYTSGSLLGLQRIEDS